VLLKGVANDLTFLGNDLQLLSGCSSWLEVRLMATPQDIQHNLWLLFKLNFRLQQHIGAINLRDLLYLPIVSNEAICCPRKL
jgi:hypothetical protein